MSPQATACSTTTGKPASSSSAMPPPRPRASPVLALQPPQEVERLVYRADVGPGHPAGRVALLQQHQLPEVRRRLQLAPQPAAELAGAVLVGVHVVGD